MIEAEIFDLIITNYGSGVATIAMFIYFYFKHKSSSEHNETHTKKTRLLEARLRKLEKEQLKINDIKVTISESLKPLEANIAQGFERIYDKMSNYVDGSQCKANREMMKK